MGTDEVALLRLWREKRGEVEPEDLSGNLLVHFGCATEELNRRWFERETGHRPCSASCAIPSSNGSGRRSTEWSWRTPRSSRPSSCCPGTSTRRAPPKSTCRRLQHNMLVTGARRAFLSILTGGAKWVSLEVEADPVYQTVLLQVERAFWRCVQTGEMPRLFGAAPPKLRLPIARVVDMATSNAWAEYAGIFACTRAAHVEHESAKSELKALIPEDAKEAFGHGLRAKHSKSGAISFDLMANGGEHARLQ